MHFYKVVFYMITDSKVAPFKVLRRCMKHSSVIGSFHYFFLEQKYLAGSQDFIIGGIHLTES